MLIVYCVSIRFVSICFVSIRFVSIHFVSIPLCKVTKSTVLSIKTIPLNRKVSPYLALFFFVC
jgi:hypothetical protein